MLQGKIPSIQPAINIRLKKAVSFTGRAAVGAGFSPFLWNVSATPMWFTKKQQALLTYKTNNTGDNVAGEMTEQFFVSGFEGKTTANNTGNRISLEGPVLPRIPLQRYLFNNVHSISANALTGFGKDWELRLNTNYVNDYQTMTGGNTTQIRTLNVDGSPSNVINYSRRSDIAIRKEQLNARTTMSRNVKENFIKNVFAFRTDRNSDSGPMYFDNDPVQQRLYSPGFSLQNSFSALLPVNKKKSQNLNLRSFINYIQEKQDYNVEPAATLQLPELALKRALLLHQQLSFRNFEIEKEASLAFRYKKLTWVPSVSWAIQNNYLQSAFIAMDSSRQPINLSNDWRNNMHFTKSTTSASMSINFDNEIVRLSVSLPVRQYFISAKDELLNFSKKLNRPAFEPGMFFRYQFHPFWNISANAGIGNTFSTIDNLYPAYIFSALSFATYRAEILQRKNQRAGGGIAYKNNLNNIFGNINYSYNKTDNNIILSNTIAANGLQTINAVVMDNASSSQAINSQIGKYFNNWRTNLQLNFTWALSNSNSLLNNVLTPVRIESNNTGTKLSSNYFDWVSMEYNFSYAASNRYSTGITTPSQSFTHGMNAFFYPFKMNTVIVTWDNAIYKLNTKRFENNFLDLVYQYNLQKRKMDFEIKLLNIFNTQTYRQIMVSAIQTNTIFYTIRPRQFLFSVKFNLR